MHSNDRADITEAALLLRISQYYRDGMEPIELYDATRGRWVIGPDRDKAQFALTVYKGVVKEVYEIKGWYTAGATFSTRTDAPPEGRWEFVGNIAEQSIRDKYINKSVAHYFDQGGSNPVRYVNVKEEK
ncbi:hypothetical protein [Desulfogranum marinum]|uniref:hypothetical protein n=1 Tax=Desulfogranum marinum TaxID=453220 RepID=UPI0029C6510E|nr:hypothetical protein [Desulfogranum marinum]